MSRSRRRQHFKDTTCHKEALSVEESYRIARRIRAQERDDVWPYRCGLCGAMHLGHWDPREVVANW